MKLLEYVTLLFRLYIIIKENGKKYNLLRADVERQVWLPKISKVIVLPDKAEINVLNGLLHKVEVYYRIESEEEVTVINSISKSVNDAAGLAMWEKIGIEKTTRLILSSL